MGDPEKHSRRSNPGYVYGGTRKQREEREACTCAPCCNCGYAGQDSDGADCYGKKGRNVLKGGVRFYGPHCFCWHAGEALADLEPCPNSPFTLEGGLECCPDGGVRHTYARCPSRTDEKPTCAYVSSTEAGTEVCGEDLPCDHPQPFAKKAGGES